MGEYKEVDLDTPPLHALLDEIRATLDRLEGFRAEHGPFEVLIHDGRDTWNDPDKARFARELLRAAELAGLLSGELHSMYWQLKGWDDPRE